MGVEGLILQTPNGSSCFGTISAATNIVSLLEQSLS